MSLPVLPLLSGLLLTLLAFCAEADCSLDLSPAALDYGSTTRGELLERSGGSDSASFGRRRVLLRIQCSVPQLIGLRFIAPAADAEGYRFGSGALQLRVVAVQLNGMSVQWVREGDEGTSAGLLRPGDRVLPWRNGAAAHGERLELELEIDPRINPRDAQVSDLTQFQSIGRFQVE